jgi:hypothetical protein
VQKSASQVDYKKFIRYFTRQVFKTGHIHKVDVAQTGRQFVLILCLGHNTTGKVSKIPAAITLFALLFPPRRACNTNKLSHTDFEGGFISMRYRAE